MAENEPVKYSKLYTADMKKRTLEVHTLARNLDRLTVTAIVQIGKKLVGIKKELDHGEWLQWLAESSVFAERSAQRAMALAEWSVSHATYYRKWADLGVRKLELLKSLSDTILRQLAARKEIKIPNAEKPKTLYDMTVFEMQTLIEHYITRPRFDLTTEVKQVKSKMRSAMRAVRGIMPHAKKMDEKDLITVEREVTRLLKELREIRKNIAG